MNQKHAEIEQRLTQARADAVKALEAAATALETAQLQAVAGGVPVPAKLREDLTTAREQLSECEGALAALARQVDADAVEAQRRARADREASLDEAAEAVRQAGTALVDAVERLMSEGPGRKLQAALAGLHAQCGGMGVSVLTPSGWETSDHLRRLFTVSHVTTAVDIVTQALTQHLGPQLAREYLQTFTDRISQHAKAQPSSWPAA